MVMYLLGSLLDEKMLEGAGWIFLIHTIYDGLVFVLLRLMIWCGVVLWGRILGKRVGTVG
jgi:hypothetical protein